MITLGWHSEFPRNLPVFETQGVIVFQANESTKSITVPLTGNEGAPATSTFGVQLDTPSVNLQLGTALSTVTVDNNHSLAALSQSSLEVGEGAGAVTVAVTRLGNIDRAGFVSYSAFSGTATSGLDFTPVTGVLDFAPGQNATSFDVPIIADGAAELPEAFTVALGDVGGDVHLGALVTSTITIVDSTLPPKISDIALPTPANKKAPTPLTLSFDQPLGGTPSLSSFKLFSRSQDRPNGGGLAKAWRCAR